MLDAEPTPSAGPQSHLICLMGFFRADYSSDLGR